MASINASTSGAGGVITTADATGTLQLQSASTTVATINGFGIGLGTGVPSSGIGITFPATQSASSNANTLDDYEEGTWTPQIGFAGVASSGATYSDQVGYYTKIGNTVQIQCLCTWTAKGSGTGIFGIVGLPFTTGGYCGLSFSPTGLSYTGIPTAQIDSGSTNIYFYQMNTSGVKSNLTNTGTGSTGEIILNAVYHV